MVLGGKLPGRVDGRRNPIFNYGVWRSLASAPDLGSGGRRFESCHPEFFIIWWVWHSWLARQIVALEVVGSNPTIHPFLWVTSSVGRALDF